MPVSPNNAALILCANERLARSLREDHAGAQRAAGNSVWEAPRIAGLRRWAIDRWTSIWPDEQLLHPVQELILWRAAIDADEAGAHLLTPMAAAREARRSDQLLRRHLLDPDRAPAWTAEHQAFRRWRVRVRRELSRQNLLTGADVLAVLATLIRHDRIAVPAAIQLCGFAEGLAPSERALVEALSARGARIEQIPAPAHAARIRRLRTSEPGAQYRAIALDIRERLRAFADGARPPPRLIVALPDPDAARAQIDAVFGDLLAPWSLAREGRRLPPWRWEAGQPLAEQPWIDAALAIAELADEANPPALISRVLLSGALWNGEERAAAAAADHALRDAGWPQPRLSRLLDALGAVVKPGFLKLAACIRAAPRLQYPSGWAQHLRARLAALGWPGEAEHDPCASQAVREFERVLARLAAMDAQLGPVTWTSALQWLHELVRSAVFDPRAEHAQPVQLMRVDEALGLSCDALYIADASLDRVPGPRRVYPFLAGELLAAAELPEADPQRHLRAAQRTIEHLLALAPEVLITCDSVDERGAVRLPSPLFGEAGLWIAHAPEREACAVEMLAASGPHARTPESDPVPAMDEAERAVFRAGSELFQAWFESPFFAFARHRLGVEPLPRPGHGLDARRQGQLAHKLLEEIWGELKDSAQLTRLAPEDLHARLAAHLDLQLPRAMPPADFGAAAMRLERSRQHEMIAQWLVHEQRRVDPFEVALREAKIALDLGGLQVSLRIDRVDRVSTPDGERWLVIDYKTGREAKPSGWNGERLSQPQLPLYAALALREVADVASVDGICFAHLKDGHPALVALSNWRQKLIEPQAGKFNGDWNGQLARWQEQLIEAARGVRAGEAWVSSKVGERSYYAAWLPLARRAAEEEDEA